MGGFGKDQDASIPPEIEEAAGKLLQIGEQKFDLGFPLMEMGASNANDILAGGIGSYGPVIQNQLETARSTQSDNLVNMREDLVRGGITGTEYNAQMNDARLLGEQEVAGVPNEFLRPTLESAGQSAFGLVPEGLSGIQGAASAGAAGAQPGYQAGGWQGALGGAASGAASGALIGTYVYPGLGTAGGAIIGGLAGGLLGAK